jgi:hypothetical protein
MGKGGCSRDAPGKAHEAIKKGSRDEGFSTLPSPFNIYYDLRQLNSICRKGAVLTSAENISEEGSDGTRCSPSLPRYFNILAGIQNVLLFLRIYLQVVIM